MLKNNKRDQAYDKLVELVLQLDDEYERACDEAWCGD